MISRAITHALSGAVVEQPCSNCGGDGSIETTRERYLDELTADQINVLYESQLERKKAENGTEEDLNTSNPSPSDVSGNQFSNGVSNPRPGSPPVQGSTKKF